MGPGRTSPPWPRIRNDGERRGIGKTPEPAAVASVRLTRPLSGEAGDEAHDGVVINDGGGEEDEVEVGVGVELVDVRRAELGLSVPGGGASKIGVSVQIMTQSPFSLPRSHASLGPPPPF